MSITRRELLGSAALGATLGIARPPQSAPIERYLAACVQSRVEPTYGTSGVLTDAVARNLSRCIALVRRGATEIGARLYVFSEFCLQLATRPVSVNEWLACAIEVPGPETERLGRVAEEAKAFVAVNVVERIRKFPGRYFLSALVLSPAGELILNYRKLYDLSNKTRPSDVLEAWVENFGPESLFPVADTEIGRIGCAVALDVNWPELVRGLVFKGAEIILNPTASPIAAPGYTPTDEGSRVESGSAPDIRTMVRRVRAFENLVYLLTCNLGPVGLDESAPLTPMVPSEIVDFRGRPLAIAADSGERMISATLDIEALRRARCTPDALNGLAQLQASVHAPTYDRARFAGVDGFLSHPVREREEQTALLREDIRGLLRRGVFAAPYGESRE